MVHLTMLSEMMGPDLADAADRLEELGIWHLDLKGGVFGRNIADLDDELNVRLADLVQRTSTTAYCFSSLLGHWDAARTPESDFRTRMMDGVGRLLATASAVRPELIRLLGCTFPARGETADSNAWLEAHAPWVYAAYRDAVDRIAEAGIGATIENEPDSIFANPAETAGFFQRLDRGARVGFTWDVQNMWQSGTVPRLAVYEALRPVINYVHLKGGCGRRGRPDVLAFRSALEQASWPVRAIVGQAIADGVSPVLCLNTPHGADPAGNPEAPPELLAYSFEEIARRDVAFLRNTFPEIA